MNEELMRSLKNKHRNYFYVLRYSVPMVKITKKYSKIHLIRLLTFLANYAPQTTKKLAEIIKRTVPIRESEKRRA